MNTTIEHLSEIVKIQSEIAKETKKLDLESTMKTVLMALEGNIKASGAKVDYDFKEECPEVYYIPAYLKVFFQNLITNSIKYRHPPTTNRLSRCLRPMVTLFDQTEEGR